MEIGGLSYRHINLAGLKLHCATGGTGPVLLLLHGYPQNLNMWHQMVPLLIKNFHLILVDMKGYGQSDKPPGDEDHLAYSKKTVASEIVALMDQLGHDRFFIAGHDRGGRVAHRMCLDYPKRIEKAAVLDIIPTKTLFTNISRDVGVGYYHWFFLAQPSPLPEKLIGGDPGTYFSTCFEGWSGKKPAFFDPQAYETYLSDMSDPACIHASCEDYRAGATIDLEHDEADSNKKIACPLLVLRGRDGLMDRAFDFKAIWQEKCSQTVTDAPVNAGHFLAEEKPEETAQWFLRFFKTA